MKKSFICEDVSIEKAIEKAIKMAGNPQIFIVKILDHGNQSLLWWKRKNIKIAFSYSFEDNYFDFLSNYEEEKKKLQNTNLKKNNSSNIPYNNNNNNSKLQKKPIINNDNIKKSLNNNHKDNNDENKKDNNFINKNELEFNKKNLQEKKLIDFTHEEINFIRSWIKEVCINFNISNEIPIMNIDNSILTININNTNKNVINFRHLSAGLVILLNETLKNTFKNFNPKNYKIIINCL